MLNEFWNGRDCTVLNLIDLIQESVDRNWPNVYIEPKYKKQIASLLEDYSGRDADLNAIVARLNERSERSCWFYHHPDLHDVARILAAGGYNIQKQDLISSHAAENLKNPDILYHHLSGPCAH